MAFLFKAMCTTAFFAFLGVGEIIRCSRSPAVLQVKQVVKLVDPSGATSGLKIKFYNFKHSYNQPQISITLSRRSDICPVQTLLDYLSHRMARFFRRSMAMLFHVKHFQNFCHWFFGVVAVIPPNIKVIVFGLGLPLSQPAAVFWMHRSA